MTPDELDKFASELMGHKDWCDIRTKGSLCNCQFDWTSPPSSHPTIPAPEGATDICPECQHSHDLDDMGAERPVTPQAAPDAKCCCIIGAFSRVTRVTVNTWKDCPVHGRQQEAAPAPPAEFTKDELDYALDRAGVPESEITRTPPADVEEVARNLWLKHARDEYSTNPVMHYHQFIAALTDYAKPLVESLTLIAELDCADPMELRRIARAALASLGPVAGEGKG